MGDAERLEGLQQAGFASVEEARQWLLEAGGSLAGSDVLGELERQRREDMEYDERRLGSSGTVDGGGNAEREKDSEHEHR